MKIFYWKESASQGLLVDPLLVAALPVGAAVLGLGKPKSDFLGSRLGAVRSVNQVATNLAQIYVSVSQKTQTTSTRTIRPRCKSLREWIREQNLNNFCETHENLLPISSPLGLVAPTRRRPPAMASAPSQTFNQFTMSNPKKRTPKPQLPWPRRGPKKSTRPNQEKTALLCQLSARHEFFFQKVHTREVRVVLSSKLRSGSDHLKKI